MAAILALAYAARILTPAFLNWAFFVQFMLVAPCIAVIYPANAPTAIIGGARGASQYSVRTAIASFFTRKSLANAWLICIVAAVLITSITGLGFTALRNLDSFESSIYLTVIVLPFAYYVIALSWFFIRYSSAAMTRGFTVRLVNTGGFVIIAALITLYIMLYGIPYAPRRAAQKCKQSKSN